MILNIIGVVVISTICALLVNYYMYARNLDKGNIIPFGESSALLGVPVVAFNLGDYQINLLLDTGSDQSYIDESVIKDLHYEDYTQKHEESIFTGGGEIKSSGFITLKFAYKNVVLTETFIVNNIKDSFNKAFGNGITVHGILGSKFFDTNNYVLDYKTMTAYKKR